MPPFLLQGSLPLILHDRQKISRWSILWHGEKSPSCQLSWRFCRLEFYQEDGNTGLIAACFKALLHLFCLSKIQSICSYGKGSRREGRYQPTLKYIPLCPFRTFSQFISMLIFIFILKNWTQHRELNKALISYTKIYKK